MCTGYKDLWSLWCVLNFYDIKLNTLCRRTTAILKQCGSDRGQIIDRASAFAISLLRDELNGK